MISRPLPPIGSEPTNRARQYLPVRLAKVPETDKAALPQSTVVEAIEDTADPGTRARYTLQSTVQSTVVEAIDDMPGLEVVLKAATRDESTVVEQGQEREVPSWWPKHPSNDLPRTSVYRVVDETVGSDLYIPTDVDPALSQQRPDIAGRLARGMVTAANVNLGVNEAWLRQVRCIDALDLNVPSSQQHQAAPSEGSSHQGETAPAVIIYVGGGTTSHVQVNDTHLHGGLKKAYE